MLEILMLIGVGLGGFGVGPPAGNPILQTSMAEFQECQGSCIWCDLYVHLYRITGYDQEYQDGWAHGCISGGCGLHVPCEAEEDAQQLAELPDPEFSANAEALRLALVAPSSTDHLKILIDENDKFAYVPEREAIQIIGCRGAVIAHIPVTAVQALALEQ